MTDTVNDMALLRQGVDWVDRLTSGAATDADAEALVRWRNQSPDHARAFQEAVAFRDTVIQAGRQGLLAKSAPATRPARFDRRLLLGGGLATAAATAVIGMVKPPLDLWPSFTDLTADYRTAKGEQRQVALARGLSVEMNTQTSLGNTAAADGQSLKLIHGEVAVNAQLADRRSFALAAGKGSVVAQQAQFNVRNDGGTVCVTCTTGMVRVRAAGTDTALAANRQIIYGDQTIGKAVPVNAALFTAWRAGLIVLRNASLEEAVTEINRYRPGMIVVGTAALRRQKINTVLHLAQFDRVVSLICSVTDAHATEIGGYVLLT